ncbi:MAG: VgrG-related protein [Actinobacteria bacterium]|nr:VgrG-related protein [Actinomycetota bacterium]
MTQTPFKIKLGGAELDATLHSMLQRVTVDDTLDIPSFFALAFRDSTRTILKDAKFKIGDEAEVHVKVGGGSWEKLFHGEITALELDQPEGDASTTIVRGYDPSHRLHGQAKTKAFLNKSYDAIVKEVLGAVGAKPGKIEAPPGKAPESVSQLGQTDWEFLRRIARLSGMVLDVKDGKIDFTAPPSADKAGSPARSYDQTEALEIKLGANVVQLRAVVTAGGQVKEVEVRGWDPKAKKELKQTAPVKTDSVKVGLKPDELAGKFNAAKYVASGDAYTSQDEVKAAAKALADQIASAHAELDGVVEGNPKFRAGVAVALGNAGKPFEGKYTLTAVQHLYSPSRGYQTAFRVSGKQDRSLFALTSGSGNGTQNGASSTGAGVGVTIGIVTDINDPEKIGRVKLKLPRFDDTFVSPWARVVYASGGKGEKGARGFFAPPKVDDEVLVAFEHGDVNAPIVIGGLYNGKDKGVPDGYIDSGKGRTNETTLTSDVGHKIQLSDKAGEEGILIVSADDKMQIHLSQKDKKILIKCDHPSGVEVITTGTTTLKADKDVKMETQANFELKTSGNMKFEAAGNIDIKASGNLKVEAGANANYKSGANTEISAGANLTAKAGALGEFSATGACTIKGAVVKIN